MVLILRREDRRPARPLDHSSGRYQCCPHRKRRGMLFGASTPALEEVPLEAEVLERMEERFVEGKRTLEEALAARACVAEWTVAAGEFPRKWRWHCPLPCQGSLFVLAWIWNWICRSREGILGNCIERIRETERGLVEEFRCTEGIQVSQMVLTELQSSPERCAHCTRTSARCRR